MVELSVIVLSYNTRDLTEKCLKSLFLSLSKSDLEPEIIVIDNASEDGSQRMLGGLKKLLGKGPLAKVFGGYHLTQFDLDTIHEIDSPTGAFYLTRRDVLAKTGGFDEQFFMYGEDLDLSYRIKKFGFKVLYYPQYAV